ncbi:VWA domain-containing protein [Amycolatopsis sp. 195334CR]|uniref:vWA domain-containing protein n=1 Tax=Amycolatopsis sp. 195334CR TaxID=2814588 RepID=UPI001A8E6BB2|nr:vWA domain-containing protein [Amycolatopsis sp. 195334CR]MBN6039149.1 VWA domain-containing protein [Amycolatopsis sp. 195334CR]
MTRDGNTGEGPGFELELGQNKYLSPSDRTMHVILTVRAVGAHPPAEAAEVLLVDCSASMDWPPTKIAAARQATAVAIDTLRDGVHFGVVRGTGRAELVYPASGLVRATAETRAEAKAKTRDLIAGGGTAMSTWLSLAASLFAPHENVVRHAILLTDGKNESESPEKLGRVLEECTGRFDCDARGIGDDWQPAELERICGALHGQADAVLADAELAADFGRLIESAMGRVIPELRLGIRTMPFSALRFAKQVYPSKVDMTEQVRPTGERTFELPTGGWAVEHREYHLCFEVDPDALVPGEDVQLGRIEPVGSPVSCVVVGHLTEDLALSSRVDEQVGRHTEQAELRAIVQAGWKSYDQQATEEAVRRWGEALRLAVKLGDDNLVTRLRRLIEEDGGGFRLREGLRPRDIKSAVIGSGLSMDSAIPRADAGQSEPAGEDVWCRGCRRILPSTAKVCGSCGTAVAPR